MELLRCPPRPAIHAGGGGRDDDACGLRRRRRSSSSSSSRGGGGGGAGASAEVSCSGGGGGRCGLSCAGLPAYPAFERIVARRRCRIRPGRGVPGPIRSAIEPRQRVGGIRKIAPSLESGLLARARAQDASSADWKAVPDIWKTTAEKFGDEVALVDPHRTPRVEVTYKELEQAILDFAEGLRVYGIRPNETVALIADNSNRWLVADQGIMAAGAANAVRGARSSTDELLHIIQHSDSVALVADSPEVYSKLATFLPSVANIKFVVVLWSSSPSGGELSLKAKGERVPVYTYEQLLKSGQLSRQAWAAAGDSGEVQYEIILPDDVATIVYTSGTSGNPKGVMLTHANLLHQVKNLSAIVDPQRGERFLSLLPPWHMYERSAEYFALSHGVTQVYSTVKTFKEDLVRYPPDFFVAVPLVFDILYSGVQKKLAQGSAVTKFVAAALISVSLKFMDFRRVFEGRDLSRVRDQQNTALAVGRWLGASIVTLLLLPLYLLAKKLVFSKVVEAINIKRAAVSGGGSLSPAVDKFFEAVGITLLNGYGLTETSPVISVRLSSNNILGSVGWPIPFTEVKVVDQETGAIQPAGVKGLVKVRGPQVMKGYYKNPIATANAIDSNGWFDTGDLGWIAPESQHWGVRRCAGALVLDGRAKDTIVLKTGENVEPAQVEEVALQSPLVQQIVVVGQDQRRLGALVVVDKDHPSVATLSKEQMRNYVRKDLKRLAADMQSPVGPLALIDEPFTVENGLLTPTMKVKRNAVLQQYEAEVNLLFRKDSIQD